jgi:hypothetical protein
MDGGMDRRKDRRMGGWRDGWMDRRMKGWMDESKELLINERKHGCMDGWMGPWIYR